MGTIFATAGCSYVPDALNPVEWYEDVVSLFEDEETMEAREVARTPVPGASQRYPSLATVPPRPAGASTPEQRTVIARGLVADRRQARVAAQSLTSSPPAMTSNVPVTAPAPTFGSQLATAPTQPPAPMPAPQIASQAATAPMPAPKFASQAATPSIQPPSPMPVPAAGSSSPGGSEALVSQTYRSQLALSAPTVSTAPAGPTASPSLTGARPAPLSTAAVGAATPPSSALPLQPLSRLGFNGSAVSYRAASLRFKTGSARIGKGDRKKLREVAALQRKHNAMLRIIGHASSRTRDLDPVTHQIVNFRISVDRAHAVARELVRLGVPPGKLNIGAKSDQERVFYEFMPAGETENQRAEIYIEY
ncbi:MAG: OmpA family protein [Alphaproteobacteria bacterium]|nr:OmpA family protein [Alphaproteobacteria bacterium]